MSKNVLDNISHSFVKNFISKNVSKISETPSLFNSKRIIKLNKFKKNYKIRKISYSTSKNLNNNSIIIRERKINPLISVYNNTFYPRSYKNKNYIREVKNCLPPLTFNNESTLNKYLKTDYESSIEKFNNIYKNNGDELEYSKESGDEELIQEVKKNKVNINESIFINKVLKDNQKQNLCVTLKSKEEFTSPKNSLLTVKVNKSLLQNISESLSKCQYQSYVNRINDRQIYKLKLCLMPKAHIKNLKFNLQANKQRENEFKKSTEGTNKIVTLDKGLINKITRKYSINKGVQDNSLERLIKEKKKNAKSDLYLKIIDRNMSEGDRNTAINSTLIRNALISDVNLYYCKYLIQGTISPNSRIEASFTPYINSLFLFGGLQTNDISDLWKLDINNNTYTWKKIVFENEINFNPRYGHSSVIFNDSLYIYGGKVNLKKLKYPLEDILVYNISTKVMKICNFKNEKNSFSQKYIYIPPRRNHIAHVIGWNMIVHGGIDISKEFFRDNLQEFYMNDNNNFKSDIDTKTNDNFTNHILGDFMALDLITFKWIKLNNIIYKKRNSKKLLNFESLPRVYHSSCLVLSSEHLIQGNKLNIYKKDSNDNLESDLVQNSNHSKNGFDIKYEGIYIFGGLDENFKETNNLYILHIFRNPLILFEPKIKGKPPSPRQMSTMSFNKTLNYILIYGGKNVDIIFGDLFILDIMNFQWLNVKLFGASITEGIAGHCAGIVNDKLYIFGGCNENNKYIKAKLLCVELDLFRNKKITKIFEYALAVLNENPKDKTAKNVMELIKGGVDLPQDIYPFLQLDN